MSHVTSFNELRVLPVPSGLQPEHLVRALAVSLRSCQNYYISPVAHPSECKYRYAVGYTSIQQLHSINLYNIGHQWEGCRSPHLIHILRLSHICTLQILRLSCIQIRTSHIELRRICKECIVVKWIQFLRDIVVAELLTTYISCS